ncbi:hypothetical protein [Leptospira stimsonii]|uniref:Uncharacterized protein n=1 Tax=Leptospira stimsonii TaxID=2202203 RepID=A0A8B3CIS7_9LEPT|nr:hypothetical protein [Leptospira stimsonii]RHX83382.1 hypothetical protein DLM78_22045 [Leptospira stimsonii]
MSQLDEQKWYQSRKYQVGLGVVILLGVFGLFTGNEEKEEPKEFVANSFYEHATDIEQNGTTIYVTFSPSLDGKGLLKEKSPGKLNVSFRWSGHGVPSGKVSNQSIEITSESYQSCTIYCEAKITFEVPKAYIGPSYLDTTLEFIPKNKTKGFKTSKQIVVL